MPPNFEPKRGLRITLSQWWVTFFLAALGIIFVLVSELQWISDPRWNKAFEVLGIAILGGAIVEFFFQAKLREEFRKGLREDLDAVISKVIKELSTAAGKCRTLGIEEVFEDEDTYKRNHQFAKELSDPTERLFCVGRSLINLFNEQEAIKKGLETGVNFHVAILSPHAARNEKMQDVTHLNHYHIPAGLRGLQEIAKWYLEHPRRSEFGSICLKFHDFYLADTFLAYVAPQGKESPRSRFFWTHFYGSEPALKRVFALQGGSKWGLDLYARFDKLWQVSHAAYELTPTKSGDLMLLLARFENEGREPQQNNRGHDAGG